VCVVAVYYILYYIAYIDIFLFFSVFGRALLLTSYTSYAACVLQLARCDEQHTRTRHSVTQPALPIVPESIGSAHILYLSSFRRTVVALVTRLFAVAPNANQYTYTYYALCLCPAAADTILCNTIYASTYPYLLCHQPSAIVHIFIAAVFRLAPAEPYLETVAISRGAGSRAPSVPCCQLLPRAQYVAVDVEPPHTLGAVQVGGHRHLSQKESFGTRLPAIVTATASV
jgi:hypothetical protein